MSVALWNCHSWLWGSKFCIPRGVHWPKKVCLPEKVGSSAKFVYPGGGHRQKKVLLPNLSSRTFMCGHHRGLFVSRKTNQCIMEIRYNAVKLNYFVIYEITFSIPKQQPKLWLFVIILILNRYLLCAIYNRVLDVRRLDGKNYIISVICFASFNSYYFTYMDFFFYEVFTRCVLLLRCVHHRRKW